MGRIGFCGAMIISGLLIVSAGMTWKSTFWEIFGWIVALIGVVSLWIESGE